MPEPIVPSVTFTLSIDPGLSKKEFVKEAARQAREQFSRSCGATVSKGGWPSLISVPLYGKKNEIWKLIIAARQKRPAGRSVESLIFIACHWAMIDFVVGTNKEKFSQGALVRAVRKLLERRKEWLDCDGAIAVPVANTLKDRCRDWLIWRATKTDESLKAIRRPKVREALRNLRQTTTEDIWKSRYCEVEVPASMIGLSKEKIKWINEQVRITKLVRSLPLFDKIHKPPR